MGSARAFPAYNETKPSLGPGFSMVMTMIIVTRQCIAMVNDDDDDGGDPLSPL